VLKLELLKGTERYDLTDAVDYVLQAFDNLALPPLTNLTERGPYQVGATLVGTRIEERRIPLTVHTFAEDEQGYWERRAELARLLTPYDGTLTLRLRRDGFITRCLDVVYDGGLTLSSAERRVFGQLAAFTLLAPNPVWYDPTAIVLTFSLAGASPATMVPTPVPTFVGASIIDTSQTITYTGDWASEPVIRINGPITNTIIRNTTTGEKLDFSQYAVGGVPVGTYIAAGEYLEINCATNKIVDQGGISRLAWLSEDSDLATFHIAAEPEAVGGVNTIQVQGFNVNAATSIVFTYYPQFLGI